MTTSISFQTSGSLGTVSENMLGGNFLIDRDRMDDGTYDEAVQDLGLSNLRYPGGTVTEWFFDINDPDKTTGWDPDRGEYRDLLPLSDFMADAAALGVGVNIVIPTRSLLGEGELGTRAPLDTAYDDVYDFVYELLSGTFGDAEVMCLEIGNEYWLGGEMDVTEYAKIASVIAEASQSAIDQLKTEGSLLTEPDIAVQRGQYGAYSTEKGWVQNDYLIENITDEAAEAIDAVVTHYYASGSYDNLENTDYRFDYLDDWSESGRFGDLKYYVTEWNVAGNNTEDLGMRGASVLLWVFSEMVMEGVDAAFVWPVQQTTDITLTGNEGDDTLSISGETFAMLGSSVGGKDLLSRYDYGNGHVYVYSDGEETVVYLASREETDSQISLDLTSLGLTGLSYEVTSLGTDGLFDDPDATPIVTVVGSYSNAGSTALFDIGAYGVVQVVFGSQMDAGTDAVEVDLAEALSSITETLDFAIWTGCDDLLDNGGTLIDGCDSDLEIQSGDGNDLILGSDGQDTVFGEGGHDWLEGNSGNDLIEGGDGDDGIIGGSGDDGLQGGAGEDYISGGSGSDQISGGADDDYILTGAGHDFVDGGIGNDHVADTSGADTVWLDSGDDVFVDGVYAKDGDDVVHGGAGNDTILAKAGNDMLFGEAGNDVIEGGNGDDQIEGGDGNDRIWGGGGADTLLGGTGDDAISGGGSDDLINGGEGGDLLRGGDGNDSLIGDIGDDHLVGDDGDDHLSGGDGRDMLKGGAGDDTILGESGKDTLYGHDGADSLDGGIEQDYIYGGDGNDTLIGGDGDDRLFGGNDDDAILGGTGRDQLTGGNGDDMLDAGSEDDWLFGGAGNDTLLGGDGRDQMEGGADDDTLFGGDGADKLYGESGSDSLDGGAGNDYIYGGSSADRLLGGAGDDRLYGEDGNDRLEGGDGTDLLDGGDGDDTLIAGDGGGWLYGGAGADAFVFDSDDGKHNIYDFDADDVIRIQDSVSSFEDLTIVEHANGNVAISFAETSVMLVTPSTPIDAGDFIFS
ncbi:calcium-binding protein [Tropicimonas sp. TH_r6]|uniref:calcium-binding protein n=1 Tax=Tropicimonas sp. TH_r6 TaxID=3082085 RepID=UPI002954AD72|nr:calcium-binding protein [Tropicimonas sp. TH_r6]MDV7142309.1 calcium-binding protein [Tropicimonas sp. TH_r6]